MLELVEAGGAPRAVILELAPLVVLPLVGGPLGAEEARGARVLVDLLLDRVLGAVESFRALLQLDVVASRLADDTLRAALRLILDVVHAVL